MANYKEIIVITSSQSERIVSSDVTREVIEVGLSGPQGVSGAISGSYVSTLEGLQGALDLVAGNNITITDNGSNAITISCAVSGSGGTSIHNDLTGIQGGTAGEYYHLTSAEYSDLIGSTEVASISGGLQTQIDGITIPDATTVSSSGGTITVQQAGDNFDVAVTDYISGSEVASISGGLNSRVTTLEGINHDAYATSAEVAAVSGGLDTRLDTLEGASYVNSVAVSGDTQLNGNVVFVEGDNITLSQAGQEITISATISGASTDHNTLANLQGGTTNEYYHLTSAEYADYIGSTEVASVSGGLDSRLDTLEGATYVNSFEGLSGSVDLSGSGIAVSTDGQTINLTLGSHTHTTDEVSLVNVVSGSSLVDVTDYINTQSSTGVSSGCVITDAGSGQINISAGEIYIRSADDNNAPLFTYAYAGTTGQALTDNSANYIYLDYNGGSPVLQIETSPLATDRDHVILGIVFRIGTELHISNVNIPPAQVSARLSRRLGLVDGVTRQTGLVTTEVGTRQIAMTAGTVWLALDSYDLSAIDTSVADSFRYYYDDGAGGHVEALGSTTIDNTNYDDGSGTLAPLSNNKYGVHWVYRGIDGDTYVVYGRGDYTLLEAQQAPTVTDLPLQINSLHSILLAKIIIQKGASSFTEIEQADGEVFKAGVAVTHNDLGGIQGGAASEYYHLSLAQYNDYIGSSEVASISGGLDSRLDTLEAIDHSSYATNATVASVSGGLDSRLDTLEASTYVNSVEGLTGSVDLSGSNGITISTDGQTVNIIGGVAATGVTNNYHAKSDGSTLVDSIIYDDGATATLSGSMEILSDDAMLTVFDDTINGTATARIHHQDQGFSRVEVVETKTASEVRGGVIEYDGTQNLINIGVVDGTTYRYPIVIERDVAVNSGSIYIGDVGGQAHTTFNSNALDTDLVINKQTSGQALKYDAGNDDFTFNSNITLNGTISYADYIGRAETASVSGDLQASIDGISVAAGTGISVNESPADTWTVSVDDYVSRSEVISVSGDLQTQIDSISVSGDYVLTAGDTMTGNLIISGADIDVTGIGKFSDEVWIGNSKFIPNGANTRLTYRPNTAGNSYLEFHNTAGRVGAIGFSTSGSMAVYDELFNTTLFTANTSRFTPSAMYSHSNSTLSALSANQNNWAPTGLGEKSVFEISSTADIEITGVDSTNFTQGDEVTFINVGSNNITFPHNSTSSSLSNRFLCPNLADITLAANESITLWYDGSRFYVKSTGRERFVDMPPADNDISDVAYTLVLEDAESDIAVISQSASACLITIPTFASVPFPDSSKVTVVQEGAGTVSISGSGVTLNGTVGGTIAINNQYQGVTLIKRGTNTWIAVGDYT